MASPFPSPTAEPLWRYERKFEAHGRALAEIEMILRLHPACFRVAFPSRRVNNIYLDQFDLRSFHTHVNGAANRQKFRIRWYGATDGTAARPVLEVKRKRGAVGNKSRTPLAPFAYGADFDFAAVRRAALAQIADPGVAEFVAGADPTLFNCYWREYLLSADRRFRLTIDRDLHYGRVRGCGIGAALPALERGAIILELKYAAADDADATRLTGRIPFRVGKYSKYLQGIQRIRGFAT